MPSDVVFASLCFALAMAMALSVFIVDKEDKATRIMLAVVASFSFGVGMLPVLACLTIIAQILDQAIRKGEILGGRNSFVSSDTTSGRFFYHIRLN